ncbi:hypothetical protein A9G45_08450 [Gilliamella sp. HK2]|nr:hypothetical protein A9G46_08360 [Gilliamella apicola]OCG27579.1 hypothetical protein A9G45_08450 [Gilliamella apicola]
MMNTLNNENTHSQCAKMFNHLQSGKTINPLLALNKYDCFRLGARIYDLKQIGFSIDKRMITAKNGKKYAEYSKRVN